MTTPAPEPRKRYPSKNTARLQAELERETGRRAEFKEFVVGDYWLVVLALGDRTWTSPQLDPAESDRFALDAERRRLLVLARRELRGAP